MGTLLPIGGINCPGDYDPAVENSRSLKGVFVSLARDEGEKSSPIRPAVPFPRVWGLAASGKLAVGAWWHKLINRVTSLQPGGESYHPSLLHST